MYKTNIVDNSVLSISAQCRCDAKYSNFVFKDNWNAFQSQNTLISLCEILTPLSIKKESKGKLKNSYHLLNISDQPPEDGILNFKNIMLVDEINSDKTILSNSDLIVSKPEKFGAVTRLQTDVNQQYGKVIIIENTIKEHWERISKLAEIVAKEKK